MASVRSARSSQKPDRLLKSTYSLDGEEIVPGFTLPVAELFQKQAFQEVRSKDEPFLLM